MQSATAPSPVLVPMQLTFLHGMLGWVGADHFDLEPLDDGGFALLRCTDTVRLRGGGVVPSPQFLVAPPGLFSPGFQMTLREEFADALGLAVPDDATLLAIVTQRTPLARSTVNLFSPIVVNRHSGRADQYVPSGDDDVERSLRAPVPSSLVAEYGGDGQGDPAC